MKGVWVVRDEFAPARQILGNAPVLLGLFENTKEKGEAFLLTVGAFLLTVKLLCLQSLKALIRRTFPL